MRGVAVDGVGERRRIVEVLMRWRVSTRSAFPFSAPSEREKQRTDVPHQQLLRRLTRRDSPPPPCSLSRPRCRVIREPPSSSGAVARARVACDRAIASRRRRGGGAPGLGLAVMGGHWCLKGRERGEGRGRGGGGGQGNFRRLDVERERERERGRREMYCTVRELHK